jgi:hypothetical protein
MAWKILQRRVQSSTYFPLGVIVPKHFLEDLALTGKSDYGTIGFAGMVPLRVKQIFCVLELLCLLSKSERPLALPAYHRVPVHCITKICWKERMPSEGNRGMTISLFFFCSIRRVLNSALAADKAKRKSNQRDQIKNTLHPVWPCLLPIPSASTVYALLQYDSPYRGSIGPVKYNRRLDRPRHLFQWWECLCVVRKLIQETSGKHEFDGFGYELCVSQEGPIISDNALPRLRETNIFKTLTVFDYVVYRLGGLVTAVPWIFCAFNKVEVSVESDLLCPYVDPDRGLGLVREIFV